MLKIIAIARESFAKNEGTAEFNEETICINYFLAFS